MVCAVRVVFRCVIKYLYKKFFRNIQWPLSSLTSSPEELLGYVFFQVGSHAFSVGRVGGGPRPETRRGQ